MPFELTDALIDHILFSMEDQAGEFYLDTVEGIVTSVDDVLDILEEDDSRFISLPQWDSADGFRLMERFASSCRNPLMREELSSAQSRGRGVFRAFKDALGHFPEAEKLWYAFKEKEMKHSILMWYNGLREEWGLEKIGAEPEETGDLVLEDFRFRPFMEEDYKKAKELHRLCQEEIRNYFAENGEKSSAEYLLKNAQAFHYLSNNLFNDKPALPLVAAMTAETGGGEFAGFISGIAEGPVFYIQNLEIKPEFRGLGIGETLLDKFLENLDSEDISQVFFDLPSQAGDFSRLLHRGSFKPYVTRYSLNLRNRET